MLNSVIIDDNEEFNRINDEEVIAIEDADAKEMDTGAQASAGASLIPSPMKATIHFLSLRCCLSGKKSETRELET